MLQKAPSAPGLSFVRGDIRDSFDAPFDLIFSNAACHWVPDHPKLLARMFAALTDAGQLAIQMPANHDQPSHTVAAQLATEAPFRDVLVGGPRVIPVLAPEAYASLLNEIGFKQQKVRLQIYGHQLASREEVVEWVKGTMLTDYQKQLSPELFDSFLARYRERLMSKLEDRGPFFFPYKRLLIWARR
jgi:trans-aconitate 2-methyltransferase